MIDSGRIDNPVQFFHDSGGLHDSEIQRVQWDIPERRVSFTLDDLHANFSGYPDYKRTRAVLIFEDVNAFATEIAPTERQRHIYDIEVEQRVNELRVRVRCSPGGNFDMECAFVRIVIEPS